MLGYNSYYVGDSEIDNPIPARFWVTDEKGVHYKKDPLLYELNLGGIVGPRLSILNDQGYSDTDEFLYSKSLDEKYRVLALGDSFSWGATADLGKSFIEVLEKQLSEHLPLEVWNAAIPATGTRQAIKTADYLLEVMKPNLVVLGLFTNDFNDNLYPFDKYIRLANFKSIHMYTLDKNLNPIKLSASAAYKRAIGVPPSKEAAFWQYILRRSTLFTQTDKAIKKLSRKVPSAKMTPYKKRKWEKSVKLTEHFLNSLRDKVIATGAEFYVLLIPGRVDIQKAGKELMAARKILQHNNISYLDSTHQLEAMDYSKPPDGHWNNMGHMKIGRLLSEKIYSIYVSPYE